MRCLCWPSRCASFWTGRRTKSLTLDGYKALGDEKAGLSPLENAVRQAADAVVAEASPTEEELAALGEAFVPAMVRVNDKGEYVRRPARWDDLPAKSHPLLELLAKARLLIVRQDGDARVVEVAHEALLRKWPRLRALLDEERGFLIGKQQLEQDLRDWNAAPEANKADALLTGLKLSRARAWLVEHPTGLTAQERAFIRASSEHAEAEDRRRVRTRRIITWGSAVASIILAIVAGLAWRESFRAQESAQQDMESAQQAVAAQLRESDARKNADANAQKAQAAEKTAAANESRAVVSEQNANATKKVAIANESRALTALSQTASSQGHYTDAVKLALAAWPRSAVDERPELSRAIDALADGLGGPLEVSPRSRHDDRPANVVYCPDGKRAVSASSDTARVWDTLAAGPIGSELTRKSEVRSPAFSPDGARVVTVFGDAARLWDAETGKPIGAPLKHGNTVNSAAFSPDGALVVTASWDATAQVWDAATGTPIGMPLRHKDGVARAAFSPDGRRVVTASEDKTAQVWDAATRAPIGKPMRHGSAVWSAAFQPRRQAGGDRLRR